MHDICRSKKKERLAQPPILVVDVVALFEVVVVVVLASRKAFSNLQHSSYLAAVAITYYYIEMGSECFCRQQIKINFKQYPR